MRYSYDPDLADRVPKELLLKALKWSVMDYFEHFRPGEFRPSGAIYRHIDHPSFCVSKDGWLFDWKSKGLSGKGAFNYLRSVEGYSVKEAVGLLTGEDIELHHDAFEKKQHPTAYLDFVMPEKFSNNYRLTKYLKGRGLTDSVIEYCIEQGLLYQSKEYQGCVLVGYDNDKNALYIDRTEYNKLINSSKIKSIKEYAVSNNLILPKDTLKDKKILSNVVFVGYDGDVPKYAAKRGMFNKIEVVNGKEKNTSFRQEITGSNKKYAFALHDKRGKSSSVHIFEAAIDAMSYASLIELYSNDFRNYNLLSMGGVQTSKNNKFNDNKVTLPSTLSNFLESSKVPITKVYIHYDNDDAGRNAAAKLMKDLHSIGIEAETKLPPSGKDFNDFLKLSIAELDNNKGVGFRQIMSERK